MKYNELSTSMTLLYISEMENASILTCFISSLQSVTCKYSIGRLLLVESVIRNTIFLIIKLRYNKVYICSEAFILIAVSHLISFIKELFKSMMSIKSDMAFNILWHK